MGIESAQLFVSKMKNNKNFRKKICDVTDHESLLSFVKNAGFDFNKRDLVEAMATCMTEMEKLENQ